MARHAIAMQQTPPTRRILRQPSVIGRVGVHATTLYRWWKRGEFPAPVRLGSNSIGWYEHEVEGWLASRATDSKAMPAITGPA